jgi:glycosyltransferase involved in cell wall biosynthesis
VRVLLVNKFLRPGAGAETVFLATRELLAGAGHEVIEFAMASPDNLPSPQSAYFAPPRSYDARGGLVRRGRDAGAAIYSPAARRAIGRLVRDQRPDVAHLHNVYHQLTLSIVDELVAQRVPVVMTLHDYKVVCPAYTLFTEGAPCRRCVGRAPVHVVPHRCIKGSVAASAVGAVEAVLGRVRRTYAKLDAAIAPSRFLAGLAATEIPADRLHVIPNFLPRASPSPPPPPPASAREPVALFAGRLEEVKGIRPLLAAFAGPSRSPLRLVVAGDGPLQGLVAAAAAASPRIEYAGRLPRHELDARLRRAAVLVLPSLWEENCPMIVLEARAAGAAVVCAASGGLPELVDDGRDGVLVDARDPLAIAGALDGLHADVATRGRMVERGFARLARDHAPERHRARLLAVYDAVAGRS